MDKTFNIFLISFRAVFDYILILASFALAYFLRVGFIFSTDFSFGEYFWPIVFIGPLWIVVMYFARCYKLEQKVDSFLYFQRVVFVILVGMALYAIVFFFQKKEFFSRLILVYIFILSSVFLYGSHYFLSLLAKYYYKKGKGTYKTLIIGVNRESKRLIKTLKEEGSIHEPVVILDGYGSKENEICGVPVAGKLNKLEETIKKYAIEQIFQTDNLEQTINLINYSLKKNLKYAMLPSLLGVYKKGYKVEVEMEGMELIRVE